MSVDIDQKEGRMDGLSQFLTSWQGLVAGILLTISALAGPPVIDRFTRARNRKTHPAKIGINYPSSDTPDLVFTPHSINEKRGILVGILSVYVPSSDEILFHDTSDLSFIQVQVKHADGSHETYGLNWMSAEFDSLKGWWKYPSRTQVLNRT